MELGHFLTIPLPQVVSPSEVTLDMESGAPQPTLSQVLTNRLCSCWWKGAPCARTLG